MKIIKDHNKTLIYLTAREKAREMGITHEYFCRLVNKGKIDEEKIHYLPGEKHGGRKHAFYPAETINECFHVKTHSIFTEEGEYLYCTWCGKRLYKII